MNTAEAILFKISQAVDELNTSIPAFVESYDATTQTASVKIGVFEPDGDGGYLPETIIKDVKVQTYASDSDNYLHIPLKSGTGGRLHFIDCDTDNYRSGKTTPQKVNDDDRHSSKDMLFIPGFYPDSQKLSGVDSSKSTLQAGTMKIELDPSGKIAITGATGELLTIVEAFMQAEIDVATALQTATVATMLGAQPLDPATIASLVTAAATMNSEKTKLGGIKI